MIRHAIGFSRGSLAVRSDVHHALSVEMRRASVLSEELKDGSQVFSFTDHLRGLCAFSLHIHDKIRVLGEERHLLVCQTVIGAVGIAIDDFADGDAIMRFLGG